MKHENDGGVDLISQIAAYRMDGAMTSVSIKEMLERERELSELELPSNCKGMQLCYYVPEFQRELKWTDAQKTSFIESVWCGRAVGSLLATRISRNKKTGIKHPFSNMLLDGQQRLNAVKCYLNNKVPSFGYYFEELSSASQEWFLGFNFNVELFSAHSYSLATFKQMYDELNFAGTMHEEAERAIADKSSVFFITHDEDGNLVAMNGKGETKPVVQLLDEADQEYAQSSLLLSTEDFDDIAAHML